MNNNGNNQRINGQFAPGNTLSSRRRTFGGGAKKSLVSEEKDYLKEDRGYLPQYLAKLRELALNGNMDALKEQISRHLGRPHQSQDLRVRAEVSRSPDDMELDRQEKEAQLKEYHATLIEEGNATK